MPALYILIQHRQPIEFYDAISILLVIIAVTIIVYLANLTLDKYHCEYCGKFWSVRYRNMYLSDVTKFALPPGVVTRQWQVRTCCVCHKVSRRYRDNFTVFGSFNSWSQWPN
jgi:hypothetical protein